MRADVCEFHLKDGSSDEGVCIGTRVKLASVWGSCFYLCVLRDGCVSCDSCAACRFSEVRRVFRPIFDFPVFSQISHKIQRDFYFDVDIDLSLAVQ